MYALRLVTVHTREMEEVQWSVRHRGGCRTGAFSIFVFGLILPTATTDLVQDDGGGKQQMWVFKVYILDNGPNIYIHTHTQTGTGKVHLLFCLHEYIHRSIRTILYYLYYLYYHTA